MTYPAAMRSRRVRLVVALALLVVAAVMLRRSLTQLAEQLGADRSGEVPAALAGGGAALVSEPTVTIALEPVARGLARPLFVTHAGDGSGRLFLLEQGGKVRVVRDGALRPEPFLDLTRELDSSGGERGLLGLAFPPDHAASGVFYVAHTADGPVVRVARYRVSSDPDRADRRSAETILEMDDPASNHNGGMIAFGPEGRLWIGTGDGGSAGDPWDNARDPRSLLGKILRLEVAAERPGYRIPADNPFASGPRKGAGRGEIWAFGLRNPWRFSFDRATGELWIGDVGQNAWEEIDVEDPREGGGKHYGWKTMEGRHCYSPREGCDPTGLEPPIHEYGHDAGCSVTGGYVYRGRAIPALAGVYLFADYCSGKVWSLVRRPEGRAEVAELLASGLAISSFGEDEAGELYLCDHRGGTVYRIVPAPS